MDSWDGCVFSCVDWDRQLEILLGVGDCGWSRLRAWIGSLDLMGRLGLAAWVSVLERLGRRGTSAVGVCSAEPQIQVSLGG